jgi:hypothetical protein
MNTTRKVPKRIATPTRDQDLAAQARPGHGIPSQDPDAGAQVALDPEDAEREGHSVLAGGGAVGGAAVGAAVGVVVAGPVGVVVGGTLGAVAGALGGAAAGTAMAPPDAPGVTPVPDRTEVRNEVRTQERTDKRRAEDLDDAEARTRTRTTP